MSSTLVRRSAALVGLVSVLFVPDRAALGVAQGVDRPAVAAAAALSRDLVIAPVPGSVTRPFEPPPHRYGAGHRGVDLAAAPGDPVAAAAAGVVAFAGTVARIGYVTVDHGGGLQTTYAPLEPRAVFAGSRVSAGDLLGWIAPEGRHLDWGARHDDRYVDPLGLLGRWRVRLVADDTRLRPVALASGRGDGVPSAAGTLHRPVHGRLSSPFGMRVHPVTGEYRMHAGIDVAAPAGRPVGAAAPGTVVAAGGRGGYGLTVDVDHGGGLLTRYAHLSRLDVRPGQRLLAGQTVGAVGSTGVSTGPHLHFEVRVGGEPRDPQHWLGG